jgi:uncharacterized membrane protein YfcA
MTPIELVSLIIIGLFAGLVGGMLGVGGSIIMIPAMTEVLGPDQHKYQAAAMIVNFFVVVPAVYQHRRARAIDPSTVGRLVPLAIVGVLAGVGISELPFFAGAGEAKLRMLFGLFLVFVAGWDLYRLFHKSQSGLQVESGATAGNPAPAARKGWPFAAAVAIPTGLVAGMLGVGGGIMAVPLQRRFLKVPIRNAIANSATIIIATSSVGAITKNYAFISENDGTPITFGLAAALAPTAIIGALIGSRWTHRLPLKTLKVAFFILLLLAGVRFVYKAARATPSPEASALAPSSGVVVAPRLPGENGVQIPLDQAYLIEQVPVACRQVVGPGLYGLGFACLQLGSQGYYEFHRGIFPEKLGGLLNVGRGFASCRARMG